MKDLAEARELLRQADGAKLDERLQLAKTLEEADLPWPARASVHVLRNYTADPLAPFLKLGGFNRGIRLEVTFSDYDTYEQDVLDPASALRQSHHDLVVLSLWLDNLRMAFDREGRLQVEPTITHVRNVVGLLTEQTRATIALHTFLPPAHQGGGGAVLRSDDDGLAAINRRLAEMAGGNPRLLLVDLGALVTEVGRGEALDPRYWFMFKAPLKPRLLDALGGCLAQAVATLKGLARKVLVLDCDGTLWGGVVGEDGLDGIKLHANEYPGNAYHAMHKQLLALRRRGVLLAICSKNNEADVLEVLDGHPHCLLRREHLAAWRINWDDKVTNLRALAKELNLGLESFAVIDDSPVEAALLRGAVPEVDVLEVPRKIFELPGVLQRYSGFDGLAVTAEDEARSGFYQAQRARDEDAERFGGLEEFLASLELRAEIGPAQPEEVARIAQLTQKTNQFNLTTRRYGAGDIEGFMRSPEHLVFVLKVRDRYGEYGLTGVGIAERNGTDARIDSFLMSCRILGRKLEDALLHELVTEAGRRWGATRVTGHYIATAKNGLVREFYESRGFSRVAEDGAARSYAAPLGVAGPAPPAFIHVEKR